MQLNHILLTAAGTLLLRVGCAQTVPPATAPATTPATDTARTMTPAGTTPMHDMADSTYGKMKMKEKRGKVKVKP